MDPNTSLPSPSSFSSRQPSLLPSAIPRDSTESTDSRRPSQPSAILRAASGESEGPGETEDEPVPSHPDFAPFFTLVEDARSGTAHHPAVRYIFSDDDGDILTDALVRLNSTGSASTTTSRTVGASSRETRKGISSTETTRKRTASASTGVPGRERAIVITLTPDGRGVAAAHSLTPDWQVLGADVAAAPTLEGEEGETGGLMLRIQGTAGVEAREAEAASLEAAVERYRERMEELRKVVAMGRSV